METTKSEKEWERTNVTNLLRNRQSATYYARVKVNGKQKWRSLKTTVFTVAKLRLADAEKEIREQAATVRGDNGNASELRSKLSKPAGYPGPARQKRPAPKARMRPRAELELPWALAHATTAPPGNPAG